MSLTNYLSILSCYFYCLSCLPVIIIIEPKQTTKIDGGGHGHSHGGGGHGHSHGGGGHHHSHGVSVVVTDDEPSSNHHHHHHNHKGHQHLPTLDSLDGGDN